MRSVPKLTDLALAAPESARRWYPESSRAIGLAALALDACPVRLADLLALFSPRVQVSRSVRLTVYYQQFNRFASDTMQTVSAAVRHYEATGQIRGPKTSAFSRALQGDPDAVVLDVWMAKALAVDQRAFARIPVREEATRRIRRVARKLDWTPAETQAAIWCAVIPYTTIPSLADTLLEEL